MLTRTFFIIEDENRFARMSKKLKCANINVKDFQQLSTYR